MRVCVVLLLLSTAAVPDTFRATSSLVLVNVSVLDGRDHPVTTLAREHFRISDNGREQPIRFFAHEDAPVSVVIVLDASGSMDSHWKHAREMLATFCASLEPNDEVALVTVGQRARLASSLTRDCGAFQSSLLAVKPKGVTPLLDAFPLAFRELKRAHNPRHAVLTISDGGENSSRTRFSEIRSMAAEANAQLYSAVLGLPVSDDADRRDYLSELAELTGGRIFSIDEHRHLVESSAAIAREIHDQYVLGYQPPDASDGVRYHRINVKVEGRRLSLFYRRGYRL